MNIIEFAMKMESDGRAFYEKQAAASKTKEIREIFQYLAEEEQRHYLFFKSLADGDVEVASKALDGGSIKITKNIFVQLIEENKTKRFGDDVRAAWTEALRIEERAVKMYSEETAKESDPERKRLLQRIADEERNHVYLCDNMLSFMADPQGFADSQDFASFKSWEGH
jgi:rubrerythrin